MVTEQLDAHLQLDLPFWESEMRLSVGTAGNKSDDGNALRHNQNVKESEPKRVPIG